MRPIELIRVACLLATAVACSSSDGTPRGSGSGGQAAGTGGAAGTTPGGRRRHDRRRAGNRRRSSGAGRGSRDDTASAAPSSPARHVGRGRVLEDRWPADRGDERRRRRDHRRRCRGPALGRLRRHVQREERRLSLPAERERQGHGSAAALRPGRSPVQSRTDPNRRQRLRHRPLHARRDAGRHVDVHSSRSSGTGKS